MATCNNNVINSGSFTKVAAPYMSDLASGPVQYLKLRATYSANGLPVPDANSVEENTGPNPSYNYVVTVGLPRPIQVLPATDPPIVTRLANPSGSQNQAIDCDKNINYADEIANGCQTAYRVNYADLDGDGDLEWRNIACTGYFTGNLPAVELRQQPEARLRDDGDRRQDRPDAAGSRRALREPLR